MNKPILLLLPHKEKLYFDGERPTKDEYYLTIAETVSLRSTCLIRRYGCVIVNNDEIIATGYNGSPRGSKNCLEEKVCMRRLYEGDVERGKGYEYCTSVHAEMNAIISASRQEMLGATLYLACVDKNEKCLVPAEPCTICKRLIENAGIVRVVSWQI